MTKTISKSICSCILFCLFDGFFNVWYVLCECHMQREG